MGTRRLRLLLTAAAGIAVVVAALATWQLAFRDTTKPASLDDALARFRAQAATANIPIPPGVYVYATTGSEFVSALGGLRHRYPARSTITGSWVSTTRRISSPKWIRASVALTMRSIARSFD